MNIAPAFNFAVRAAGYVYPAIGAHIADKVAGLAIGTNIIVDPGGIGGCWPPSDVHFSP